MCEGTFACSVRASNKTEKRKEDKATNEKEQRKRAKRRTAMKAWEKQSRKKHEEEKRRGSKAQKTRDGEEQPLQFMIVLLRLHSSTPLYTPLQPQSDNNLLQQSDILKTPSPKSILRTPQSLG